MVHLTVTDTSSDISLATKGRQAIIWAVVFSFMKLKFSYLWECEHCACGWSTTTDAKASVETHCWEEPLQWRHNGRNSVSIHQYHDCLLNLLFRRRSKKTSKLRVTGFVWVIHRWPVNSPHKWPVTRKMLPLDDVIMTITDNVVMNIWDLTRHISARSRKSLVRFRLLLRPPEIRLPPETDTFYWGAYQIAVSLLYLIVVVKEDVTT